MSCQSENSSFAIQMIGMKMKNDKIDDIRDSMDMEIAGMMAMFINSSAEIMNFVFKDEIGYRELSQMIIKGIDDQMHSSYGRNTKISCMGNTSDYKVHSKSSEKTSSIIEKIDDILRRNKIVSLNDSKDDEAARLSFMLLLHAEKSIKSVIPMTGCKKFDRVLELMCEKFLTPCVRKR